MTSVKAMPKPLHDSFHAVCLMGIIYVIPLAGNSVLEITGRDSTKVTDWKKLGHIYIFVYKFYNPTPPNFGWLLETTQSGWGL